MTIDREDATADGESAPRWLTPGVGAVGAASFFSDTGHEVTTSVLPTFLTSTLGAPASALGVIDGISDALTGVMKLVGGPLANDPAWRGRAASGGYIGTAVATGAIGAAVTVWQAGLFRAIAWLSRGLRSPARDALLASLTPTSAHGRAFGLGARRRQFGGGRGTAVGRRTGGLGGGTASLVSRGDTGSFRGGCDYCGGSGGASPRGRGARQERARVASTLGRCATPACCARCFRWRCSNSATSPRRC